MKRLSHQPSKPAYYILDWWISGSCINFGVQHFFLTFSWVIYTQLNLVNFELIWSQLFQIFWEGHTNFKKKLPLCFDVKRNFKKGGRFFQILEVFFKFFGPFRISELYLTKFRRTCHQISKSHVFLPSLALLI